MPRLFHVECDPEVRVPRLLVVPAVFGQPIEGDGADALCADHSPPGGNNDTTKGAESLAPVSKQPGTRLQYLLEDQELAPAVGETAFIWYNLFRSA